MFSQNFPTGVPEYISFMAFGGVGNRNGNKNDHFFKHERCVCCCYFRGVNAD